MSTKRERVEARRAFEQEQQDRECVEAQIAELEKQPGGVSDEQLAALGLTPVSTSPAIDFLRKRLSKVPHDDPQFDGKWKLAIIDLVAGDVPLDPRTRSLLAGELRRLYFPNDERDKRAKRQIEKATIKDLKDCLLRCGMTAAEAEREIVETIGKAHGITSVAALRKRLQRASD